MLYREIAERISAEITAGMQPGTRLPGLREFALKNNISLVTARNVYKLLEERGLVVTRQGAGTFVAGCSSDGTVNLADVRAPQDMLLWVAGSLRISAAGLAAYDPPQGYEPLREQAGLWLGKLGVRQLPIITSGSQQAMFLSGLALLRPGDVVAVDDPGYVGAVRIFESLGAVIKRVPYLQREADLDFLRDDRIRLFYTMPQGQVPTGRVIPPELRSALLRLADRHGFYIIENDPLSGILSSRPLKADDGNDRVIYLKSLSTVLGPGMRIAFAVPPEALTARFLELKEINDLSLSGILQRSLCAMLQGSDFEDHLLRLKKELEHRLAFLRANTAWHTRGPCLWLKTDAPSRVHQNNLLKMGVRVTPGDVYGPQWSNHLRLSLLAAARPEYERAIVHIRDYLEGFAGPRLKDL